MSESELPLPIADDDSGDLEWLLGQLEFCAADPDEQILPLGKSVMSVSRWCLSRVTSAVPAAPARSDASRVS